MGRRPRVLLPGGIYHVHNRVSRGVHVSRREEETDRLEDLIATAKARDDLQILARCVMSNHFHLAIRSSVVPLPRTMHYLQGRFSREFNRRHGRNGPLRQSPLFFGTETGTDKWCQFSDDWC